MTQLESTPSASSSTESSRFEDQAVLVDGLRAGDPDAAEFMVREYAGRMLAMARRYLPDEADAEDAVQDAFVSAFRAMDSFKADSQLSTWLIRIVINACLMKLRKARRMRETTSIDHLLPTFNEKGHLATRTRAWAESSESMLTRAETRQAVQRSIQQLPENYRTVLMLRDIEELDTKETAEALELTESAVKVRLHRARQALRTLLEKELLA